MTQSPMTHWLRFLRRWVGAIALATAASAAGSGDAQAQANCSLRISNLRTVDFAGNFGRGYEVFHPDQFAEIVEVTVERVSGSCSFVLGFSTGSSGNFGQRRLSYGGKALYYNLYKGVGESRVLKDVPAAAAEELFAGSVSSTTRSVTFNFAFIIPLQQVVSPGTYTDNVTVRVYEGTALSAQLRDQQKLDLHARVPTVAQFTLGDQINFETAEPNVCVDFGDLTTGATRDLKLRARSNSGYRIMMESRNGGVMRITDPKDTSAIAYRMEADCVPFTLQKWPQTILSQSGVTSAAGREHVLLFTIGDVTGASAGAYQDVIVVTMYPTR